MCLTPLYAQITYKPSYKQPEVKTNLTSFSHGLVTDITRQNSEHKDT